MSVFDERNGNGPQFAGGFLHDEDLAEPGHLMEERFRLLIESVKDYSILMLDPEGIVATWNVGAERIYGYRAAEIVGTHFSRLYPPEDVAQGKCIMELRGAAADGRYEDEGWRVRKDGTRFWANAILTVLRNEQDEAIGFAKVTRDLTERRAAEEERWQLGQAARERVHLLAGLSEALSGALSEQDVANVVLAKGMQITGADTCTLHMLDDTQKALDLVAEHGCSPDVIEHIRRITASSKNATYSIGTGESDGLWVESAQEYAESIPEIANLRATGSRAQAFWCVPLHAENRTIGMLGVGFYHPRKFPNEEREFIATFARLCAQSLARARLMQAERTAATLAEKLRASLATTVKSIGDALIATDAKGFVTLMNTVAESLTGWSESEACGKPLPEVFQIFNEHTRQTVQNPVDKVLETGGIAGLANHTILRARDGREIPIDDSGAPIRAEEGGQIEGVVLVFRDVTERKREESRRAFLADATAVLSESLDYERTVAKVAELAVPRLADWCAVDLVVQQGRVPKRLAVAHVDPSKIKYAQELDAKYPPQIDATSGVPNVLRTGRSELYKEIPDELLAAGCVDGEHLRIARELKLHSAMVVPLVTRSSVLGAISFVYAESRRVYTEDDLHFAEELARRCAIAIENARVYSSEQQARRRADVANRAKDEFLAVVSHELRTPLNAIMGWAKLLAAGHVDERRQKGALETIERNSVAMAQLIEDLLDMSRVISGKLRIDVQQVDMAKVLRAAIESIQPGALAKGIDLVTHVAPSPPRIYGDATRLQQIVWNLLSNAVKFTPKGGRVEIVLGQVGSSLELRVSDTGKGIASDFLPRVFEPFRQEDVSPSRSRGGLGLGLAITRQLVELHGGHIAVHSEGEGRGASFTVTLPISAVVPARTQTQHSHSFKPNKAFHRPTNLKGLRVLVVDDEADARNLVSAILEECDCEVILAQSVDDAMQKFEKERPDVMLSDIGMPGQDGYDLIRRIRALPRERGGDIPAAALTAYARTEDRRNMLNAGYSIHLPKPIEPAELVAVVSTLCRFLQRPDGTLEST